ncbi:hypothetical protein Tco_0218390 [Tanacetum coccineum]
MQNNIMAAGSRDRLLMLGSGGGQLNAAPVLEVENFTNWKKRLMCHIIGIEPQFENIIKNGRFIPMTDGQRKSENEWPRDERKAADLDQRLKSSSCLLPKKWLSLCQCLVSTNNVKDFELVSLFDKLKYKENLIDNIYKTGKNKSLVSATSLSTAFFSSSIVQDFQDSPDAKEDTRSSHEFSSAKQLTKLNVTNVARRVISQETAASKASMVKNKGLIAEAYEWDKEEVSSDDNEMVEVKCISEQIPSQKKRILGVDQLTEDPSSSRQKDLDTGRILPAKSQSYTTDPSVNVTDSSKTIYDSTDESSVCSTLFPLLKKLDGAEPISGP